MTRPAGRVAPPLRLRLKAKRCGCVCHRPSEGMMTTPTHHGLACCAAYVGTVNEGWSGWSW
jgi:hypothetical protein